MTALAASAQQAAAQAETEQVGTGAGKPGAVVEPESSPPKRSPAHYLWAVLIARIYEVFPLLCPMSGGQMRLIAFITEGAQIKRILEHIGEACEPPHIAPARGPTLWMTVMRRRAMVSRSSRTGIWRRNRHPTLMSIRARQLVTE